MRRYGAKKDANHAELVNALAQLRVPFLDLSTLGGGCPDGLILVHGELAFVEFKNPKTGYGKRGLNKLQRLFVEEWHGARYCVIRSIDDVIAVVTGKNMGRLELYGEWGTVGSPEAINVMVSA